MVSVAEVLPPFVNVAGEGREQVIPEAAEQVSATVPVNPLTDVRLTAAVLLLPAVTVTFEVLGMSVKSESGFEIGAPLFSVKADGL